jgi:hypothetical protein
LFLFRVTSNFLHNAASTMGIAGRPRPDARGNNDKRPS